MLPRILKYAVKNILRNKFLSISSILVLTLLIFFINILFVLHNVTLKVMNSINDKLTISLYLKDTYDKNSTETLGLLNDINRDFPNIKIDFKSKDQVMEELKKKDEELIRILNSD
jgi:cell division protein FtsX